jgi:hypothetical protein
MQLSPGVTIVNETLFLETHIAMCKIGGKVNDGFAERLRLYYHIKQNR